MEVEHQSVRKEAVLPEHIREEIERAVAAQIPDLVHLAVSKEEERRFRQLKWVAAFIGIVGVGTFGTLATFMIEKAVDSKAGGIKEALELTRINGLALSLSIGKGFSPNERDEAMALLIRISKAPSLKTSQDVRTNLTQILKSFTSAGLEAEVDQLFGAFREEILTNGMSSEILLHHYGQQLVGRMARPSTEDFALKSFESLEHVASGHELAELALAYRVLYDFTATPSDTHMRNLLSRSLDFSEGDSIRFLREILIRTKATNWQRSPTPEGRAFERVTRTFFGTNKKLLSEVYGTDEGIFAEVAAAGVRDEDEEELAQRIVKSAKKNSAHNTKKM